MFEPIRTEEYGYIFDNSNGVNIGIYLFNGDEIMKNIDLHNGGSLGDFNFSLDDNGDQENLQSSSFAITSNNLLYDAFNNLLSSEDYLMIDDDWTNSIKSKYLEIKRVNNDIILEFFNYKEKQSLSFEKYSISVKNTLRDLRSKIDQQGLDTKDRLWIFFNEAFSDLKSYSTSNQKTKK